MNAAAALVFARCAGFVSRAPGFSHPSVPMPLRAALAGAFTLGLLPAMRALPELGGLRIVLALACEFLIGAAIGMASAVLYDGAFAGGRMLDDYVGIRGSVPSAALVAPSGFGRLWSLVMVGGFFLLDGYAWMLRVFANGFVTVPPGSAVHTAAILQFASALPLLVLRATVMVAGPAIAVTFAAQLALGALGRVVPRFATFTLSFPIVFALALIATLGGVALLFPVSAHPWIAVPFLSAR